MNYYVGTDPSRWYSGVPTFARVHYQNVYPGVNLVFYAENDKLEFDFQVAPGSDPAANSPANSRYLRVVRGRRSSFWTARVGFAFGSRVPTRRLTVKSATLPLTTLPQTAKWVSTSESTTEPEP